MTNTLPELLGPLADLLLPHLEGESFVTSAGRSALAKAQDAKLPEIEGVLAPGVELFPYQRAGVRYALDARRAIIGHDMGLGKTIQAIAALAIEKSFPALVVCPPSLALNWQREFRMFAPHISTAVLRGTKPGVLPEAEVLIIGSSVVKDWEKVLAKASLRALVIDESQQFKSREAKRTVAMKNIAKWLPAEAMILLLSGTFVKNRPDEAIPQLQILDVLDGVFGGVFEFLGRYYPKVNKWDREARNIDDLHARLLDTCYARLTFDEVRHQLGDKAPQGVMRVPTAVEMGGKAATEYREARSALRDYLLGYHTEKALDAGKTEGGAEVEAFEKTERSMRAEAIVQLNTLRRLIGLAKVPAVISHVQNLVDDGEQVIVFANHREVVKSIAEHFGARTIMGGDKVEAVEEAKARFQAGTDKVIVLNIVAGGTGHTLTAAHNVVFAEFPWTPADVTQAEARADRIGQTELVLSHWLMGANGESTIDERLVQILNDKAELTGEMLDGKAKRLVEVDDVYTALLDWAREGA